MAELPIQLHFNIYEHMSQNFLVSQAVRFKNNNDYEQ